MSVCVLQVLSERSISHISAFLLTVTYFHMRNDLGDVKLLLTLPICRFRIKGAAWLPVCLVLPVPITRTSSATSLFTPSSRRTVCSPSFLSEGSRCYTPRLPPALMSPPPRLQAPRAARASVAAAERDLSTGLRLEERTSEPRTSCPPIRPLRRQALTPGASRTADRRRMSRPA